PKPRQRTSAMSRAPALLVLLAALPALVVAVSYLRVELERLRRFAVAASIAMLLASVAAAASPVLRTFAVRSTALTWAPGGEAIVRVDNLSAVLLPFAAGLWLLTVAVTPRAALDAGGLRRT